MGAVTDTRLVALPSPVPAVRLWSLDLTPVPGEVARAGLSDADRARLAGLRPADAGQLVARRVLVRTAVAEVAGCPAESVDPVETAGPRRVRVAGGGSWYVSSSVSGPLGLLAVARTPVGADVERRPGPPDATQVARTFLPPAELAWITAVDAGVEDRFLDVWVRKEAVVKYTGEGMSRDLRSFVVDASRASAPVLAEDGAPLGIRTYAVAVPGHAAAITVEEPSAA